MVRTTIYLDEGVRERLQRLIPPRKMNHFIKAAVADKVALLEQRQLEEEMKEGYLATNGSRTALIGDWEPIDLVDWPE